MENKPVILIVDDDKNTREGLGRALKQGYDVLLAESGEKALEAIASGRVDVLLSDVRMPGMDGLTLLPRALAANPKLIVIMLTAYGNVETAVEAMKRGAADFLTKPVDLAELDERLRKAVRGLALEAENLQLRRELDDKYGMESIVGSSPPMLEVFELIRQAAPTSATVLVQGESGTGKELVARAIHRLSQRSKGPFVAVHCAALAASLLESELFGHERGAFTGATARKPGRFELADGGTLFLDEVSEIDAAVQVKLLRVLEERRFERVGGRDTVQVDIRLVAATNRNLKQLVEEGKFRADLYFRLDVVNITLPPLRERLEDVPLLTRRMLKEFAAKDGKAVDDITPEAMALLSAYAWPGNVRELRNTVERMVVLSRTAKLTVRDVPPQIRSAVGREGAAGEWRGQPVEVGATRSLEETERLMIFSALKKHGGSRTLAARALGISRRTLHRKLNRYRDGGAPEAEPEGDAGESPAPGEA